MGTNSLCIVSKICIPLQTPNCLYKRGVYYGVKICMGVLTKLICLEVHSCCLYLLCKCGIVCAH